MAKILDFFKKTFTKENMMKFFRTYIWLIVITFVIDIVSKWSIVNHFGVDAMNVGVYGYDEMIPVIPGFLYIGGSINPNAAFSIAASKDPIANRVIYICISAVMSVGFTWFYIKEYKKLTEWTKVALALMISGAVGNLIDRAFYWESTVGFNGVIDWIRVIFFYGTSAEQPFAMFNIADSCLVVGVAILIVIFIVDAIKEAVKKNKAGEYKYSPEELEKQKETKENEESSNK